MEGLYKYPSTFHFPFSAGLSRGDKVIKDLSALEGMEIVASEKMDGENMSAYPHHTHARSLDSINHPSRNWVKGYWAERQYLIPNGWRVCGENLYAQHSLAYDNLKTYFYCFSIWNDKNICLSIDETLAWCELLDIVHVPILYRGKYDYNLLTKMYEDLDKDQHEGFVVRLANEFHYNDFDKHIVKAVRPDHVQTDEHWMDQPVIPNKLIK